MTDIPPHIQQLVSRAKESERKYLLHTQYRGTDAAGCVGGPYVWQQNFHNAGARKKNRAIIAGNRTGKTRTIAAEVAAHLTGWYPDWWEGHRHEKPIIACVSGITNEETRNVAQYQLLGEISEVQGRRRPEGTGWIPWTHIGECHYRQCGVTNVVDTVRIRHVSGLWSKLMFKSYEQGPLKFQGFEADIVWFDEEPEDDKIFSEAMTRLIDRRGSFLFSRTPLFGHSTIIRYFMDGTSSGTWWTTATWDDAPHLDETAKKELLDAYPPHERDARTKGVPMMGAGAVYPISDDELLIEPIPLPRHWRRICGIDFGMGHPAAAAWLALDSETDILYLYDCYKKADEVPLYHAAAIKARGSWIPVAWPQDGLQRDKGGSGIALAEQYRAHGVNTLDEFAHWDVDTMAAEAIQRPTSRAAGSNLLLERMHTGRFKVFRSAAGEEFLKEKRMLHRASKPPFEIVPEFDDIESAVRYGLMMLRFALTEVESRQPMQSQQQDDYNPLERFSVSSAQQPDWDITF